MHAFVRARARQTAWAWRAQNRAKIHYIISHFDEVIIYIHGRRCLCVVHDEYAPLHIQ